MIVCSSALVINILNQNLEPSPISLSTLILDFNAVAKLDAIASPSPGPDVFLKEVLSIWLNFLNISS